MVVVVRELEQGQGQGQEQVEVEMEEAMACFQLVRQQAFLIPLIQWVVYLHRHLNPAQLPPEKRLNLVQ